jgi:NADPH2:quinone reductase
MHAIRLHEFGPPERLLHETVQDPQPGPEQVRIAVAAAGVHLIDTTLRAGWRIGVLPLPELPAIPGREVAGVVDAIGAGVDPGWAGRRVVAHLGPASGGYAELAVAPVKALHALPDGLGEEAAVAMIGTGRTTAGLLEVAQIGRDDVVLVTAAAGGIGTLVIQSAREAGAVVVGAAGGAEKTERVRALGADVAVDYSRPGWDEEVREALGDRAVTVALDGVGGALGRTALELLGTGGRIVLYGFASGSVTRLSAEDLYARGLTATAGIGPRILNRPGGMRDLEATALERAATGAWTASVTPFPLAQAAAAHAALEARATMGKVVLRTPNVDHAGS